MNFMIHSVPKIVALMTMHANEGARAYVGHCSWNMQYYFLLDRIYTHNDHVVCALVLFIVCVIVNEPSMME